MVSCAPSSATPVETGVRSVNFNRTKFRNRKRCAGVFRASERLTGEKVGMQRKSNRKVTTSEVGRFSTATGHASTLWERSPDSEPLVP